MTSPTTTHAVSGHAGAGVRLSRHDHHNLEIKTWVEPGGDTPETLVDLFLFIPSSFQTGRWNKTELNQDFRSRVRLALPRRPGGRRHLDEVLEQARLVLTPCATAQDFQQMGSLLGEVLKHRGADHRRRLVMAHALSLPRVQRARELERLLGDVNATSQGIETLRAILAHSGQERLAPLLDEYVSNLQVKYLAKLRRAMSELDPAARANGDDAQYPVVWKQFELALVEWQRQEATYRQRFPHRVEGASSSAQIEQSVVRLGQLKKFFHAHMFVDVSRHSPSSRFLETTAVAGTAVAGCCWAMVQFLQRPELVRAPSGGFVFTFAVLAYVLRDRIKDRAKASLHQRVSKWLPDANQQLQAEGRDIGSIREWLQLRKRKALPESIRLTRLRSGASEIEQGLPEDVLHLRKRIQVRATRESPWALQENTRINVERYLKYMDDPIKELAVLDDAGELSQFRSRRVYHFHVALAVNQRPADLYRVVLDKDGIDRLERVS